MLVQMNRTNKLNLALVDMLGSFPSNMSIPNIVAIEFVKDSRMLIVFDPFGYRWNIHNMTDIKMHSKVRPSQSFQWKGAMKVVQENWSTFLSKSEKKIINTWIGVIQLFSIWSNYFLLQIQDLLLPGAKDNQLLLSSCSIWLKNQLLCQPLHSKDLKPFHSIPQFLCLGCPILHQYVWIVGCWNLVCQKTILKYLETLLEPNL